MYLGAGQHYSNGNQYSRLVNVQLIGVDSKQPYHEQKILQGPSYFIENNMKKEHVIKQEDMQYDLQQSLEQSSKNNQRYNKTGMQRDRSQINSLYKSNNLIPFQTHLTYSCITNNEYNNKGSLKQGLQQMKKIKFKSQYQEEQSYDDKNLYIELEKEKKLRGDLQKSYKNLLAQLNRNQRYYSVDFNQQQESEIPGRRPLSKRTLKQNPSERIIDHQLYSPLSANRQKQSETKTVRFKEYYQREGKQHCEDKNLRQIKNNSQNQVQIESNLNNRNQTKTEQSIGSIQDYFQYQKEFQQRILYNLNELNVKVDQMGNFLSQKQQQREKYQLVKRIEQRQNQIAKLKAQKTKQQPQPAIMPTTSVVRNHIKELNQIVMDISPSSLYVICIIVMAIVAIA